MKKEKDKLEQFIKDNRDNFDSEFNPEQSWDKIESKIPNPNQHKRSIWMVAASIVLLLSVTWLIYEEINYLKKSMN